MKAQGPIIFEIGYNRLAWICLVGLRRRLSPVRSAKSWRLRSEFEYNDSNGSYHRLAVATPMLADRRLYPPRSSRPYEHQGSCATRQGLNSDCFAHDQRLRQSNR